MLLLEHIKKILELYITLYEAGAHYTNSTDIDDRKCCLSINFLLSDIHNINKSLLIYWPKVVDIVTREDKHLPNTNVEELLAEIHESLQFFVEDRDKRLIVLDKVIRDNLPLEEDIYYPMSKKLGDEKMKDFKDGKSDALGMLEMLIKY